MTTTTAAPIRNGVDTAQVYGTLDALKAEPELAHMEFRVSNRWIDGPHSRSTIQGFWGAGAEDASRPEPFVVDASEPPAPVRPQRGAQPGRVPPARPRRLHDADDRQRRRGPQGRAPRGHARRSRGVLDARGATGLDDAYRNGFERIAVEFTIRGDAPPEKLQEIVERAKARSVVYDMVTNGVPVELTADVG